MSILRFTGELDSLQASLVRKAFAAVPAARRVAVDLTNVAFIDSAGLGALIGGIRRLRETGGDVVICCTKSTVLRLLYVTGMDRIVRVEPDVDAALSVMNDGGGTAGA